MKIVSVGNIPFYYEGGEIRIFGKNSLYYFYQNSQCCLVGKFFHLGNEILITSVNVIWYAYSGRVSLVDTSIDTSQIKILFYCDDVYKEYIKLKLKD